MVNEVGADKAGAACYDDSHGLFLFSFGLLAPALFHVVAVQLVDVFAVQNIF